MSNCKAYHIFTGTGERNGVVRKEKIVQLYQRNNCSYKVIGLYFKNETYRRKKL